MHRIANRSDLRQVYNRASKHDAQATKELRSFLKKTVDPSLSLKGGVDARTKRDFERAYKNFQASWNQDSFQPAAETHSRATRAPVSAAVSSGGPGGGGGGGGGGAVGGSGSSGGSAGGAPGGGSSSGVSNVNSTPVNLPGNVDSWIQQALQAMGISPSDPNYAQDVNALKIIIQHESGGNPNAINNWDSNAQAGHPSQGLMQTIPSTFAQYALPGHNNILNPVDNIIAGARYAMSRYGSIANVPGVVAVNRGGSYVGY